MLGVERSALLLGMENAPAQKPQVVIIGTR
jgi:hypothetical protein